MLKNKGSVSQPISVLWKCVTSKTNTSASLDETKNILVDAAYGLKIYYCSCFLVG